MEQPVKTAFPSSVDINPTALCNLACSFCWGPDHNIPDGLDTADWKRTLDFLSRNGTRGIVVTGGEPLIRPDLGEILAHAKSLGLRVTLSTNCLLLRNKHEAVLPYVDDIGVPLDGPTAETNQLMRIGNRHSFAAVGAAMPLIRAVYPRIKITVRTVVSRVNAEHIAELGRVLAARVELFDRWKLYQFAPFSIGAEHVAEHAISSAHFESIVNNLRTIQELHGKIESQTSEANTGRYVFIGPQGDVTGVTAVGIYRMAGNVLSTNLEELASRMRRLTDPQRNAIHATFK